MTSLFRTKVAMNQCLAAAILFTASYTANAKTLAQITAATISLKGCEGRSLVKLGDKFNVSTGLA